MLCDQRNNINNKKAGFFAQQHINMVVAITKKGRFEFKNKQAKCVEKKYTESRFTTLI